MTPLALAAFLAATLGAISGLGGGIFIMPLLVQSFGEDYLPPGLAAISLSVVLLNAFTALVLGGQWRNVDVRFARQMAVFSAVGAVTGVFGQSYVSRAQFELYLAVFLAVLAIYVLWKAPMADARVGESDTRFTSKDGAFSYLVGVIASFFGIGGGVLQVPYMVYARHRPVKQATATSQVILASVAVISLAMLIGVKSAVAPWSALAYIAPAVVVGGVLGSRLAQRLRGPWVIRILGGVLLILAYRVLTRVLQG